MATDPRVLVTTESSDEKETPPADVMEWVREAYTKLGVAIWLSVWRRSTPQRRANLERLARTANGGT